MDFMRFHEISWFSWISGRESLAACVEPKKRPVAPIETFARSQLVAISSIFIDFMCFLWFHEISLISSISGHGCLAPYETTCCPYRNLCSIPAGCYFIDFHGFHLFSRDFMRFRGFRGSHVGGLLRPVATLWRRGPAPIETFARS